MKKIHIALVGGQPIPVYLGIVNHECDEVVLVHSNNTLDEAQRIEKNCAAKCTFVACSPNDLAEIKTIAGRLKEDFLDCDVVLNITSGTKLWSVIFFQVFSDHPQTKSIYVDQLNNMHNVQTNDVQTLSIDIRKRFELYGNPLTRFTPLYEYTLKDRDAIAKIEKVRRINKGAFTDLTNSESKVYEQNEGSVYSSNGSKMTWDWEEGWVEFTMMNYAGYTQKKRIELDHPKELILYSSWFEIKTALELQKNPDVKGIYLNCEFPSQKDNPKNEIDIIADFGTRLLFVECKTMIKEITDIDKFRSAMRNFSGTSSTPLFVTNDKVTKGSKYDKYDKFLSAMEKCKDNDIPTFNFSLWDGRTETSMNAIINEHLRKINKR